MNYSNSLLNAYRAYKKDAECGLLMQALYIDKSIPFGDSDVVNAGIWFEYKATGQKLLNGDTPEPVLLKSNAEAAITKHLTGQLNNFNELYQDISILESGKELLVELNKRKFKGILDVLAESDDKGVHIRDIKTSGLLDNKREEGGWEMLEGEGAWIPEKKHINQAKMYIWLWFQLTGEIVPFVFDVFSNKNPNDFKVIQVNMDEDTLIYYEGKLLELCDELDADLKKGLEAKPHYKKCKACPLLEDCDKAVFIPESEMYYL